MASLLAHIKIQPGKEEKWEAIMHDMVNETFRTEDGVIRYEYWKGQEDLSYYCLLSFKDKLAFTTIRCQIITKAMTLAMY